LVRTTGARTATEPCGSDEVHASRGNAFADNDSTDNALQLRDIGADALAEREERREHASSGGADYPPLILPPEREAP
jgi:hypothetical protein